MIRTIIDIPRLFWRAAGIDWRIDWRGQSAAADLNGGEQVVYNQFPRIVGSPQLVLPKYMIGEWRAYMSRAQGRVNAVRARLIDPAVIALGGGSSAEDWEAWQAGQYEEPRPKVILNATVSAGATTISVDERDAPVPVRIGQWLSYDDWPFLVETRSGSGASVTLGVAMLRKPISAGAEIDMYARGIFAKTSDDSGDPGYGGDRIARPQIDLIEWITR